MDVLYLDLWMCCIYSCGCVVFRAVVVLYLDLWMCYIETWMCCSSPCRVRLPAAMMSEMKHPPSVQHSPRRSARRGRRSCPTGHCCVDTLPTRPTSRRGRRTGQRGPSPSSTGTARRVDPRTAQWPLKPRPRTAS